MKSLLIQFHHFNNMISLKNLAKASLQEIFDQAANHLLTQNEQAIDNDICRYRLEKEDGTILKCAGGCFIADDEYSIHFENHDWDGLKSIVYKLYPQNISGDKLILKLQQIHDEWSVENWKNRLTELAQESKLDYSILNNY